MAGGLSTAREMTEMTVLERLEKAEAELDKVRDSLIPRIEHLERALGTAAFPLPSPGDVRRIG